MKNINDLLQENRDAHDQVNGSGDFSDDQNTSSDDDGLQNSNNDSQVQIKDQENVEQSIDQPAPANQPVADESVKKQGDQTSEDLKVKMKEINQKEIEAELSGKTQNLGVGYINLKGIPIPVDVLQLIPLEETKQKKVISFYYAPHRVVRLATTELDTEKINEYKKKYEVQLKTPIEMYATSQHSFDFALKQYEDIPKIKPAPRGVELTQADLEKFSGQLTSLDSVEKLILDVPTTELVALIIAAGFKTASSDIHIESEVDGIKLRYRIDGVLHTATNLAKDKWQQLISRLKLLSNLKLNVTDKPQDGRFSIFLSEEKIDVRVSTLPTQYGESVVMRLLLSKAAKLDLDDLGVEGKSFEILARQIKRPNGMIITTGPTGSGKTTTLYAILHKLNSSETKIITIEDPIEYELKGVNQSQIDPEKDYTFAKGLRSIVRQDPDIVMVGEMRDLETVDIALNAALTGHLVLSTLHTNDAAGAIPRFLSMGAKPYLLAPALNLIMAQRLVRKLCDKCKKEIELTGTNKDKVAEIIASRQARGLQDDKMTEAKFYTHTGCDECNGIGYKGRIGIYEMFEMTKEVEEIILSNQVSEYQIKEINQKNGMLSMAEDGIIKAMRGVTSVEEVFRVVE